MNPARLPFTRIQYEKVNVFFIHHHIRNHDEVIGLVNPFAARKSSETNPERMNRASNILTGLNLILFSAS